MNAWFRVTLLAVTFCSSPSLAADPASSSAATLPRPNIVYILCDDLGTGDVRALNPQAKTATPHMDSLARDGMTFTDAHSGSAVCTPTRYGILTGRYAWRTRLKKGVLLGYDAPLLEPGRMTVASLLSENGYATACVGKWHLGLGWQTKENGQAASLDTTDFAKPLTAGPNAAGFDYSFIIPASLDMDPFVYIENGRVVEQPNRKIAASPRPAIWRAGWIAPSFTHETTLATLTQKVVAYLDERGKAESRAGKRQPFFLYLPLTSPHTPHVPRPEFRGKSQAGNYGDFVQETDWAIGQVLDSLKRTQLDASTLVILTSDNGAHSQPVLAEGNGHQPSGVLRGQKSDLWEGGHRVPFLARRPNAVAKGSMCDQTICLGDLLATAAELTAAPLPNDAGEDSVSFLPLLLGKTDRPTRESIVHHSIDGTFAIRQGEWKLIPTKGSGGWSMPSARAAKEKDLPDAQLYDLQADPREQKNVQADHPRVVAQLKALLQKHQDEGRSVPKR